MAKKPKAPLPETGPCDICSGAMQHIRTIPAAGAMQELHSFHCTVCGCPRTEEQRVQGSDDPEGVKYAA